MGNNAGSTLNSIYKATPVGMIHDGVQGKRPEATTGEFWKGTASPTSIVKSPMQTLKGDDGEGVSAESLSSVLGGDSETNFLGQFSSVLQGQANSNVLTKSLFAQTRTDEALR